MASKSAGVSGCISGSHCIYFALPCAHCTGFNVSLIKYCVAVFVVQVILTSTLFNLSRKTFKRHFSPSDSMCVVFCGVHKSLTLGIPILGILYEGSPDLQTICLPLLIYHPMQIAFGGLLAPYFRNYVRRKTSFSTNKDIPI